LLAIGYLQARLWSLGCYVFYGYTAILIRIRGRWLRRKCAILGRAVIQHTQRGQALISQLQRLNQLPEARRSEVLAARTTWMREAVVLKTQRSALVVPGTFRMTRLTIWIPVRSDRSPDRSLYRPPAVR